MEPIWNFTGEKNASTLPGREAWKTASFLEEVPQCQAIAQKCTGCAHLLDNGWSVPRCVDACSTGALWFGDIEDYEGKLDEMTSYPQLEGLGARVYVKGYPKRFCAGLVCDLSQDEVIISATVQLLDDVGALVAEMQTDDFGDFKFDQIEAGRYELRVSAEGFTPKSMLVDASDEDVVFPEIAMER